MFQTDSRPARVRRASTLRDGVCALAWCAAWLMLVSARAAPALELGGIEARSQMFEPLNARIALHDVDRGDLAGLAVTLGTPAQFELAGVAREDVLKLLRFDVVEQDDGGGHVRVWTSEPIIEPRLTFLVSAEWARGRTIRGYSLALRAAAAADTETPASVPKPMPQPRESAVTDSESKPDSQAAGPGPDAGGTSYGPVRKNETLWSIATSVRPDRTVSVQHMMLALLEANPDAFAFSNVNALNAGATLRIPTRAELGATDQTAAIAEVRRQHSVWEQRSDGRRVDPPRVDRVLPAEAPSPGDSELERGGRVELVAPESTADPASPDDTAATQALRNELALAMEEADAGRRESNELKLRLSEAEDHIKELGRLIELKNEEIAALQAELRAIAATDPLAAPVQMEGMPEPALAEEDAKLVLPPTEEDPNLVLPPADEEPKPVLVQSDAEPSPTMMASEEGSKPDMAPSEGDSKPALALGDGQSGPAPDDGMSLPFDLDALRVNPVFLVGGAGILLVLLGVVALLRRRRSAAGDEGDPDSVEGSPGGDDNILVELEAVAAELADDEADARDRKTRSASGVDSSHAVAAGAMAGVAGRTEAADPTEDQIARLWQDTPETEPDRSGVSTADHDGDESSLRFEVLTGDHPESDRHDDERDDEFDIRNLAEFADESGTDSAEPDDDTTGDLESLFRDHDVAEADSGDSAAVPDSRAGGSPERAVGRGDGPPAAGDGDGSGSGSVASGSTQPGSARTLSGTTQQSPDGRTGIEDAAGTSDFPAHALFDDAANDRTAGEIPLDDVGEDEIQTKIDLAQVYMEMGDHDSARGFLEAVLADGDADADRREIAREMLSRLP